MKESDILGVKTYSDPSFIFSGVKTPTPESMPLAQWPSQGDDHLAYAPSPLAYTLVYDTDRCAYL